MNGRLYTSMHLSEKLRAAGAPDARQADAEFGVWRWESGELVRSDGPGPRAWSVGEILEEMDRASVLDEGELSLYPNTHRLLWEVDFSTETGDWLGRGDAIVDAFGAMWLDVLESKA